MPGPRIWAPRQASCWLLVKGLYMLPGQSRKELCKRSRIDCMMAHVTVVAVIGLLRTPPV